MAASVALLGWDEEPIRVVQDARWKLRDRADSANKLTVTTSLAEADGVDDEQELIFKSRRFVVAGVVRDRAADEAVITAREAQAALARVVIVDFRPNSWTLTRAMNAVLEGTRWTLGEVNGTRYGRADFDEITAMDALHFLARHQDAHLSFDSLRRRVNITQDHGTAHEYVFTYGRQLSNITKDTQQPTTTIIYPVMADDVVLDPVEDYGYYLSQGISLAEAKARFRKEEYWDDSRYEIAENMTRDAEKRLEEEAWPSITYTLTAQATVDVEGVDDFDLAELHLGDTVYVWDQDTDTKLLAEVTAVTTSSGQSQNELTLSTLPASLGDSLDSRGYYGDSGSPDSGQWGRVIPRSGFQPRPSMPIKESVSSTGVGTFRWNGQDHEGNFDTIPARFGHVRPRVARLLDDGTVPSPESADAFGGTTITTYDGGTCIVSFGAPGEYAVWFQMVGADGQTVSEHSEPWVGVVDEHVDTEVIEQDLAEARERLDQAEAEFAEGNEQRKAEIEHLREVRIPDLEEALNTGLDDVYREAQQYAESQADNAVNQAAANAQSEYDRLQEIAERALSRAGDNVLEDPSFETDLWPDEWDGTSGLEVFRSSTSPRTGDYQLRIRGQGTADLHFESIDVELGQSYRFGIYWATLGYGPSSNTAWLVFKDTDTGDDLAVSEPMETSGYHSRLHVMMEVPEGTESITPAIRVDHADAATLILDDASLREVGAAAEALRAAEQARHEAQKAHELAGDAVDAAASAYDAASSKSTVHWSLSAPSGTADNSDDVWWQYELRNGRRVVTGQWFWDDGVWRETEIAEEWLPQVNIGTGTYGDLSGDRLEANTVQTTALAVMPDAQDYAPNPGKDPDLWTLVGAEFGPNVIHANNPSGVEIRLNQRDGTTQVRGPVRPVTPGKQIRFRGFYTYYGSASDITISTSVRMEWFPDEDGSIGNRLGFSTFTTVSSGSSAGWVEGIVDVPEDALYGRLYIYQGSTSGGVAVFRGTMMCEPMTQGVMIEPEGIRSPQVDTLEFFTANAVIDRLSVAVARAMEITAEQGFIGGVLLEDETVTTPKLAVTDEMVARFAQFLRVQVDMLDFNRMVGMAIESGLIEGGTVRGAQIETTGQSAREIKIDGNGISGYNSSGTRNFHVNTSGHLTAQNATVEGHILAQTARLIGELRVGRSGVTEGGIVPANNSSRIRLLGRVPDSISSTDMFTVGYTPYYHYGNNWGWTRVNYATPTPYGGRIPMVTANMDETYMTAYPGMVLNTRSRSESSFDIIWHKNVRAGPDDPRMSFSFFGTWGRGTPTS